MTAQCQQVQAGYITMARKTVTLEPLSIKQKLFCESINRVISMGKLTKEVKVSGYHKVNPKSKKVFETVENSHTDSITSVCFGMWIDIPNLSTMSLQAYNSACHTVQHCILALAPVYVTSCTNITCQCSGVQLTTRRPRLLIYDSSGRHGTIETLSLFISTIIQRSKTLMENCNCEEGCDECVFVPQCSTGNTNLDRLRGIELLDSLINKES